MRAWPTWRCGGVEARARCETVHRRSAPRSTFAPGFRIALTPRDSGRHSAGGRRCRGWCESDRFCAIQHSSASGRAVGVESTRSCSTNPTASSRCNRCSIPTPWPLSCDASPGVGHATASNAATSSLTARDGRGSLIQTRSLRSRIGGSSGRTRAPRAASYVSALPTVSAAPRPASASATCRDASFVVYGKCSSAPVRRAASAMSAPMPLSDGYETVSSALTSVRRSGPVLCSPEDAGRTTTRSSSRSRRVPR